MNMANFTKQEQIIHRALVPYDNERKAEGYAVSYRRWVRYTNVADGLSGKQFGEHVESLYIHPSKPALLVKTHLDGHTSGFEAVP